MYLYEDQLVPPSSFGIPEEDTDSSAADNTKCFSHKIRLAAAIYLFSSTHIYGIIS